MTEKKRGPGRPKGSPNKKKKADDTPSTLKGSGRPDSPSIGHNGPEPLTEAEQRALMIDHARTVRKIEAEIKELQADRKSAIGEAKADGIPAKDIVAFNKLQDQDDEDVKAEHSRMLQFLRWQGRGVQGDLIELLNGLPEQEDKARSEGFQAGVEGLPAKTDLTGAAHDAWLEGYHQGAESLKTAVAKRTAEELDGPDPMQADIEDGEDDEEASNVVPLGGKKDGPSDGAAA